MIEFRQFCKYFVGDKGVFDLNLTFEKGSFSVIEGHSGSGKSTLLKAIYGEYLADKGSVFFQSQDLKEASLNKLCQIRRKCGLIFQDLRLFEERTVEENLLYFMYVTRVNRKKMKEILYRGLLRTDLLQFEHTYVKHLSGGEKQRLALCRSLLGNIQVLIADEPLRNLDKESKAKFISILKDINRQGTTIIMSSHEKIEVYGGNIRILELEEGKIIKDSGTGYDFYHDRNLLSF